MTSIATQFAPAERAGPEELETQRQYFADSWFFGELLHYVPDMVMILNRHRQVVYANRPVLVAARVTDLAAIVGKRPGEVFGCRHADETDGGCGTTLSCRYCGAANSILQSQNGKFVVEECRMTVRRDGGEEALDLRVWASPMQHGGRPFTFFAIGDIADEKKRLFLERIFLHDILNTASALRGFSQLLRGGKLDADTREEFTRRVASLSNRIIEEIEAHRVLVAAEHGELTPRAERLNSLTLLTDIFDAYNRPDVLDERGLSIAADSDAVEFTSDRMLLSRVVGNMVKNGIEGSLPGETVTMGCRAEGASVAFWVQNPTYMPEKVRLQVFNRSFSTKGAGRGIGTYSMKFLTERYLGGVVEFASSESDGTTFTARYPRVFPGGTATRAGA